MIAAAKAWLSTWALQLLGAVLVASLIGHAAQAWHARGLEVQLATAQRATSEARAATDQERAGRQQDRAGWAVASAQAEVDQREIETLRRKARDQVITDAHATIARQAGAAAHLRSVVDGLRGDLAAGTAAAQDRAGGAAGGDPAAGTGGAPAGGAGLVLTELRGGALGQVAGLAADLAIAFDAARARGLSCERAYDSLSAAAP